MSNMDEILLDDDASDLLLSELGEALAAEISSDHVQAAIDAFWVARTDALIVEVEEHLDAGQRAGVRGETREREHVYRLDEFSVSLIVDSVERRVSGRIEGACLSAHWLDADGSSRLLELDDVGRFRVSPHTGPASVEVVLVDGRRMRTTWTLL